MKHITIAGDVVRVLDHGGHQFIPVRDICEALHLERHHQLRRIRNLGAEVVLESLLLSKPSIAGQRRAICVRRDTLRVWVLSMTGSGKSREPVTRWKMALAQEGPSAMSEETIVLRAKIAALEAELLAVYRKLAAIGGLNNV